MTAESSIRIGIDVGGTFTHAVAIEHRTLEILKSVCFPTTHDAPEGVARGILQCLEALVGDAGVGAGAVVFIAHSTTQATNALLEGDVAHVGLIGLVSGMSASKAKKELEFGDVPLAGSHAVRVSSAYAAPDVAEAELAGIAERLKAGGAGAFVVAQPFAVDDPSAEIRACGAISAAGLPVTATHQVSGLYGLRARARTSVVNAGILPRMMEVSSGTKGCVERIGISAPLMVMRSDGGVMDVSRMATTPILTILSGPAAGVSAAILHQKLSNGLFVEVGGTSTDVSLILDGRPQRKNAVVGGHVLYLKTLDVRTVGVAGGSMVRVKGGKVVDVGPRSAHIAGLGYSCFEPGCAAGGPRVEFISPVSGDPDDYAVAVLGDGRRVAITTTCAANALGLLGEGDYSRSNTGAGGAGVEALAAAMGRGAREVAEEILDVAASKVAALCTEMVRDYQCGGAALEVVGGGGGASVVAPLAAKKLSLRYSLAANAPVVSAVGAAMAMMKEYIEKSVVSPTEEDMRMIRSEAVKSLTASGCDPATIEVEVEVDSRRGVLRATATGTSALVSDRKQEKVSPEKASELAGAAMGVRPGEPLFSDGQTFVFQGNLSEGGVFGIGKKTRRPAAAVDAHGIVKLSLKNARAHVFKRDAADSSVAAAIRESTIFGDGGAVLSRVHLIYGGKVIELSKAGSPEAASELASMEIREAASHEIFCIISECK